MKIRFLPYRICFENGGFFACVDVYFVIPRLLGAWEFDFDHYFKFLFWDVVNGKI